MCACVCACVLVCVVFWFVDVLRVPPLQSGMELMPASQA